MSTWTLRILTGLQKGAEIELAPGEYQLGNDDDSDLLLNHDAVKENHFTLQVDENGVHLKNNRPEVECLINGAPSENEQSLQSQDIISIDNFHFGVAVGEVDWDAIHLPKKASVSETPPMSEVGEDLVADAAVTETPQVQPPTEIAKQKTVNDTVKRNARTRLEEVLGSVKKTWVVIMGVTTAGIVCLSMMAFATVSNTNGSESASMHNYGSGEEIASILNQDLSINGLKVALQDDNTWNIDGYLQNQHEFIALKLWLENKQISANINVVVMQNLIEGAEIALTARKFPDVEVAKTEISGALKLTGRAIGDTRWQEMLQELKSDINGVTRWIDEVEVIEPITSPDISVVSVSIGDQAFAVTERGERIFEGSVINSGYTVESISLSHLILNKGGERVKFTLIP